MYESDIDIKIYNQKKHEVFLEKSLLIVDNKTNEAVAAGNECVGFLENNPGDYTLCTPFALGKITDYAAAEKMMSMLFDKHIGKRGPFSAKPTILLAFHEPLSAVEKKVFEDMAHIIGGREIHTLECLNTWFEHCPSWEKLIWDILDNHEKFSRCAIEFTKTDTSEFAEQAAKKLIVDGMRWGFSKEELIDMIKNCDESKLRNNTYHCY